MDLTWKTVAWDDSQINPPALQYKEAPVTVVQISQKSIRQQLIFNEASDSKVIKTQDEWDNWLDNVCSWNPSGCNQELC